MRKIDITCAECGKIIGRFVCKGNEFLGINPELNCIKSISQRESFYTYSTYAEVACLDSTYAEVACSDCEEKISRRLNPEMD